VGRFANGTSVLPVNQRLSPTGRQVYLPKLRPQAMALSPDGKRLAVSGKTSEVLILDPATGEILQRVPLPPETSSNLSANPVDPLNLKPDPKGQASFTGLLYAHSGKFLYLANVDGSIKVFTVDGQGAVAGAVSWPLPPAAAPRRKNEIPSGLALSADDRRLYVCGNLGNRLLEMDTATGTLSRQFDTGVAPFDVVLAGGKAWVSDLGGRRPGRQDLSGPAGRGALVKIDPVRQIACEGAVSVVDLASGAVTDLVTGLHACALAASPDGRFVAVANAGQDSLTVFDVRTLAVAAVLSPSPNPADLLGATPNALAFSPDGKTLWVANGTQNAVAVLRFDPKKGGGAFLGLLPVGWYPGAIAVDAQRRQLLVANIKGMQGEAKAAGRGHADPEAAGFNTRQAEGSLSFVPFAETNGLEGHTRTVWSNFCRERVADSLLPARPGEPPRPVPERSGEPSPIKHCIYVIKENRTYDQVLGDLPRGNGHPGLCVFGEEVTPNQHKIAGEFVLLDNAYCCGILSADGHQWTTSAFANEYLERQFAGFPRSYPAGGNSNDADALAYSSAGFLWDLAKQRGVSLRNYGEFMHTEVRWKDPARKGAVTWLDGFRHWRGLEDALRISCSPLLDSIREFSPANAAGWSTKLPDQWRADFFLRELAAFETNGDFPSLLIVYLPNDHNNGAAPGYPTPAAFVADNDLAFGRLVEGVSRSRFWKETAIFAIEDDPQAGWDHVSGYRTTVYLASPWARRGAVVSTRYNTTSLLRTMEQILGLPPLNQFDASATPMHDCFTNVPDFTPYTAVPNRVPLDQMNPPARKTGSAARRRDALVSMRLDFSQPDRVPDGVLNRILWRAMRGEAPFPSWACASEVEDD